jgi:SAM-dependent methyltransferase
MKNDHRRAMRAAGLIFATFLAAAPLLAQQYEPTVGQEGKDVIWVPTPEAVVAAMLDVAEAKLGDFLVDLGSGDGRIAIAAAKKGIRAMGIEYSPEMVQLSKELAEKQGLSGKVEFRQADIFESDFSQATIVTMYLLPQLNLKLRPKILDMKPGTRIVAHAFDMGDWQPDRTEHVEERSVYLWIVPAKVEGTWASNEGELSLKQNFQKVEGTGKARDQELPISDGKLRGDRLTFNIKTDNGTVYEFAGTVNGKSMTGTVKFTGSAEILWTAECK